MSNNNVRDELRKAEVENVQLRAQLDAFAARIANQADALSRTAEGRAVVLLEKLMRLILAEDPDAFRVDKKEDAT